MEEVEEEEEEDCQSGAEQVLMLYVDHVQCILVVGTIHTYLLSMLRSSSVRCAQIHYIQIAGLLGQYKSIVNAA